MVRLFFSLVFIFSTIQSVYSQTTDRWNKQKIETILSDEKRIKELNQLDVNYQTAPVWAIYNASNDLIEKIAMSPGVDLNIRDLPYGETFMHKAIEHKDLFSVVEKLIKQKRVDINVKTSLLGDTPLHIAVQQEEKESIKFLMKYKANVDIKNDMGFRPVSYASDEETIGLLNGRDDVTKALESVFVNNSKIIDGNFKYDTLWPNDGDEPVRVLFVGEAHSAKSKFNDEIMSIIQAAKKNDIITKFATEFIQVSEQAAVDAFQYKNPMFPDVQLNKDVLYSTIELDKHVELIDRVNKTGIPILGLDQHKDNPPYTIAAQYKELAYAMSSEGMKSRNDQWVTILKKALDDETTYNRVLVYCGYFHSNYNVSRAIPVSVSLKKYKAGVLWIVFGNTSKGGYLNPIDAAVHRLKMDDSTLAVFVPKDKVSLIGADILVYLSPYGKPSNNSAPEWMYRDQNFYLTPKTTAPNTTVPKLVHPRAQRLF